jgi:beta-phosphoglucomutase-like phosphatase (HAD superfamily)
LIDVAGRSHPDSLAFLFELDGTLVDSIYQHVLAGREATQASGIELPVWRIHRQIGVMLRSVRAFLPGSASVDASLLR